MARVSVAEAAKRLGVIPQRVHQRIRDGSLPAERVGGRWVIDELDLGRLRHHRAPGRPLSEKSAWALLAAAAGDQAALSRLDPSVRSRARSRLRNLLVAAGAGDDDALVALARALRNRADRRLFYASPRDLPDLADDGRVRLSGTSLPEANMSAGNEVEGYVAADDVEALANEYLLSPADRSRANVVLHVVSPDQEARDRLDLANSVLALAADLAEHDGPREHDQALRHLAALREQLDGST